MQKKKILSLVLNFLLFTYYTVHGVGVLATVLGPQIIVRPTTGVVQYAYENSTTSSAWYNDTFIIAPNCSLFARYFSTSATGGYALFTWTIYNITAGNHTAMHSFVSRKIFLDPNIVNQKIYASVDGLITDNYNWGIWTSENGTYQIELNITAGT